MRSAIEGHAISCCRTHKTGGAIRESSALYDGSTEQCGACPAAARRDFCIFVVDGDVDLENTAGAGLYQTLIHDRTSDANQLQRKRGIGVDDSGSAVGDN